MNKIITLKLLLITLILPGLLLLGQISYSADNDIPNNFPYTAQKEYEKILRKIVTKLERDHYSQVTLNDAFGEDVLERYLEQLDPRKIYFLAEDIKEFQNYSAKLDDDIQNGSTSTAFIIYNRYYSRRLAQFDFLGNNLAERIKQLDFSKDEYLSIDTENLTWPTNQVDLEDIWRKILKNEVLNLKFSEKKPEEIITVLEKKFKNQRRGFMQNTNDDVFQLFISAYTHGYDPHTDYFPPRESENFDIHMSLSLEGIGALLQQEDEYIKVVRLIPAGPAELGGILKPSDRIIGIAQEDETEMTDVIGWRLDDAVDMIRGPKGSKVSLLVIPADATDETQTRIVVITRDTVKLEEQSAKKYVFQLERDNKIYKIGVIKLPTFYVDFQAALAGERDYRSTTRDVEKLLKELIDERINSLIIDLRDNGGGSLQEASDLTGLFIPAGPVVQIRSRDNKINLIGDPNLKMAYNGPMAVLVNRLSASASEIFAGAIQDYGRGLVVGNQTFGKGTVQNVNQLDPGQLKYTQAKFYRISGDSTQVAGVMPDILLPQLLNQDDIGEGNLPHALPWDKIPPTQYRPLADLKPLIGHLDGLHIQRTKDHPDFRYFRERTDFFEKNRNKKQLSLNETLRSKERSATDNELISIENERRKAKSMPEIKSIAELETEAEEKAEEDKINEDSFLHETGEILLDWLLLKKQSYASK